MSGIGQADLGILSKLAEALGIFSGSSPNTDWFANPEVYLKRILANPQQRSALLQFVDEALGGADNTSEKGVIWVPLVKVPDLPLSLAMTVDESRSDGLYVGVGLKVITDDPVSVSTLSIPLFCVRKDGATSNGALVLLGDARGRIKISTQVTVSGPPVPGQARLGAIGLALELPTGPGSEATFGFNLSGLQMPGAATPIDINLQANSLATLDDALLDLVLSLIKAQADANGAPTAIVALGGLLGLKSGDNVPDFPITQLPTQGVHALSAWVLSIVQNDLARNDWLGHIGSLLGGARVGSEVKFSPGPAALTLTLPASGGPNGHTLLQPRLVLRLGTPDVRVQVQADLMSIDLVTGQAQALPAFTAFAASGRATAPVLNVTPPPPAVAARAETLRIGFAIDAARKLSFVLAADQVTLGSTHYPVLDLTSSNAVMDAVGNTVADIADELLSHLGGALAAVQQLLGLSPPPGIAAVTLPALMSDPVGAVSGYWQALIGNNAAATTVLQTLRKALADASEDAAAVLGAGTAADPWRLPLIGPLALEAVASGSVLSINLAARTNVDTLGQRCTVVSTRVAAQLARIDLAARSAQLMLGAEASLQARERGVSPPRAKLQLSDDVSVLADDVGLRLSWSPSTGLKANVSLPNPRLVADGLTLPLALPVIGADGLVSLPPAGWDAVQLLVGHLAGLVSREANFFSEVVHALGWQAPEFIAGGSLQTDATLPLADLVADPTGAIKAWLPTLLASDLGPRVLSMVADLLAGNGNLRASVLGRGSPQDPYRFTAGSDLPEPVLWFPPAGLQPLLVAAPQSLREWRPGMPALDADVLEAALRAEALAADDVADLVAGRANAAIAAGIGALVLRFAGGDGRIAPPVTDVPGVDVRRMALAAGQLWSRLDIENATGRVPTTAVHVALGAPGLAWPDAPPARVVDLSTAGLEAAMFTLPAAATGDWFVALGTRANCLLPASTGDGTAEQAARLSRWLAVLQGVSNDIALVAVAGAGHAARMVADSQSSVTDLVLLGTPLTPISLTTLQTQPAADVLRLLHRLLPTLPSAAGVASGDEEPLDAPLELGVMLVRALMELEPLPDAGADLRPTTAPAPATRAGLAVTALFGSVSLEQAREALTAIVASGLAARARARVAAAPPAPVPTGVRAGLRWTVPERAAGLLAISAQADLSLLSADLSPSSVVQRERVLTLRLMITDRAGWLAASPTLSLRAASLELTLPLDGTSVGSCKVTLHEASVFGQSWERLRLGHVPGLAGIQPVLPEARVLLATLVQRLTADVSGPSSVALADVMEALGLVADAGGVVANAIDQLVHDPGGLIRQRMAGAGAELQAALSALLGPLAIDIDWGTRTVAWQGGGASSGRFGWTADVQLAPSGASGSFKIGPDAALPLVGGLQLQFNLQPFGATLVWRHAGGGSDSAALWPTPDAQALARMLAHGAPALAAQVALEGLRRADDAARPMIDAALDALGFLSGAAADAERSLRPLAGLLRDPLGWLGSAGSLAAQPVKIQSLFDAMRPLMGLAGAAGSPLPLAPGVSLSAAPEGGGARLAMLVDPSAWAAADPAAPRLAGGIGASLVLKPGAAPSVGLDLNLGLAGVPAGKQAVHVSIGMGAGGSALQVFLRPGSGADIPLLPFAGLGALSAAASSALPYLLDRLAERPAPVGPLVAALGDALLLRSGAQPAFSNAALQAWAVNPVQSLRNAAVPMVSFGLQALANAVDAFVPASINVAHSAGSINVTQGVFTLGFNPSTHAVTVACNALPVPGIQTLTAALVISDEGLRELSFTLGPAAINAGGVTVRPFVTVAAGAAAAGGARVLVGLAGSSGSQVAARWLLSPANFAIVAADGLPADAADFVAVLIDLAAAVALAQPKVDELLDSTVSGALTVRNLLRGVVLADVANPDALIANLFVPAQIPARVRRLFLNLADEEVAVKIEDFTISFMKQAGALGLQVGLDTRLAVPIGDVTLWIENDDSWIEPNPAGTGGLFVGFLNDTATAFQPKLVVNGLGLRLGKQSGPLIDLGLSIESVALHLFADISSSGVAAAGVQLQFANLGVPAAGAGGDNGIAQGLMRDTGPKPPKPMFSPALAVQKHGNGNVAVSLRAGDPPGPWWIAIQKGFGPLYLEQVGFDARMLANGKLERVSVLMDGSVSLFGLTCAVDDLQVTYFTTDGDFLNAANWQVDLAGLAVAADMAGLSIAGGLLKQETTNAQGAKQTEYLGMLLGRFAVYGLTIYGGYGEGVDTKGNKFTAFFAIGAVNGPIGGPPAFFLTGIGGGFGINRLLKLPTDLSKFGEYPLIQALDIAASPGDPMQQLRTLGAYFPMNKGTFWFAAGLSFTSFALVDGIAVVGVQIGDGLDINLLGLARMALPRPQVALVSIEVALIVRFSSSEGVLWVQGQLTDNSWLLYEDIKLTGGFAYVIWFKGERAGEFVLTLGGYHPDFKRAGYPVVPRLGLRWSIGSTIVIKAGSYFALTSEALMAGGDFEASAKLGPAWAEVKWGAHGIVYFDPFSYSVSAYAHIAAGVTIDLGFLGDITFSISLGARIQVEGPDFRGSVTFEIGPLELTFEFGGSDKAGRVPISADAFVTKYLERADSGAARAHALMTSTGALPSKGEDATPDGSSSRPLIVVVEFSLAFTTTVPAVSVTSNSAQEANPAIILPTTTRHDPSRALAVGPMGEGTIEPEIVITWQQDGLTRPFPFKVTARPFSRFPVGVWGPAGDLNNRKVPKADMVEALSELDLACTATPTGGGPEIPYFQVEIGKRLPLPFARADGSIQNLRKSAKGISALVADPATVDAAFGSARRFLGRTASPTALAAMRGERQAPPRMGTLAEGLESPVKTVVPRLMPKVPGKVYDHVVDAPRAVGLFGAATVDMSVAAKARTTVKGSAKAWRMAPPTLAAAMAVRSRSVPARLLLVDAPAVATSAVRRAAPTFIGAGEVPLTGIAHAPTAIVARTGAPLAEPLAAFNNALAGDALRAPRRGGKARAAGLGAQLAAGECVVLKLPNAKADAAGAAERPQLAVASAPARVVLLDIAGQALADVVVNPAAVGAVGGRLSIPRGTESIVVIGQGLAGDAARAAATERAGLHGWHAGLRMPYVGHGNAVGPGCIVHSTSDSIAAHGERADAGWVSGAELARGITTVSTRFAVAPRTVIVVVDDPAVTGRQLGERQLLLGLEGADRATDATGAERPPLLMTMDNRSLLAYEVVPEADTPAAQRVPQPVQVNVASDDGWSLVAVMASSQLDPQAALNLIAARGLQAALLPLAPRPATAAAGGGVTRLDWIGPVRSPDQQRAARARASGAGAMPPAPKALGAGPPSSPKALGARSPSSPKASTHRS